MSPTRSRAAGLAVAASLAILAPRPAAADFAVLSLPNGLAAQLVPALLAALAEGLELGEVLLLGVGAAALER